MFVRMRVERVDNENMAKLSKLIISNQNYKDSTIKMLSKIEVFEKNKSGEFYTDPRTVMKLNELPRVKPFAESVLYIYYVCPYCRRIHIESKRFMNVLNRRVETRCKLETNYIIIDWKIEAIAHEEAFPEELTREWEFMKQFEDIRVREIQW